MVLVLPEQELVYSCCMLMLNKNRKTLTITTQIKTYGGVGLGVGFGVGFGVGLADDGVDVGLHRRRVFFFLVLRRRISDFFDRYLH
jgi:hypothetical protein